jgi:hypothetical protein
MGTGIECARMRGAVADASSEAGSCLLRYSESHTPHELIVCYSGLHIKQPTKARGGRALLWRRLDKRERSVAHMGRM